MRCTGRGAEDEGCAGRLCGAAVRLTGWLPFPPLACGLCGVFCTIYDPPCEVMIEYDSILLYIIH